MNGRATRRPVGRLLLLAAVVWSAGAATLPEANAATRRIRLPSQADLTAKAIDPSLLGNAPDPLDSGNKLPGPVNDVEKVTVSLSPDGSPFAVKVAQTLTLTGTGDFAISLPGPALDVHADPSQVTQPGLRKGRIIWQGFVAGTKVLAATATLDPVIELTRLPLSVRVRIVKEGRVAAGPVSGPVAIELRIANETATDEAVDTGVAAPREIGAALDSIRAAVAAGARPAAGRGGVPKSIAATGPVGRGPLAVQVPYRVRGQISFGGKLTNLRSVTGATPAAADRSVLRFDAVLPSSNEPDGVLTVRAVGTALGLAVPSVNARAVASLPDVRTLTPRGASWVSTLAGASPATLRNALSLAERSLWQVLRLPAQEAYLGNPKRGASHTEFVFATSTARRAERGAGGAPKLRAGALVLAAVAAAFVIGNSAALWRRS